MSNMKRRQFITVLGGAAAAWPLAAQAQTERVRRIGVLMQYNESDPEANRWIAAFKAGLQERRWAEGHNVQFEFR
jgi:hypothetical protein